MQIFLTLTLISATTVADYPFRNTSLPWKERVDDLVSRLTLEEIKEHATSFPQAIGLAATFRYLYFKCPVLGLLV